MNPNDDHRLREAYYNQRNNLQDSIMAAENQGSNNQISQQDRSVPQGVAGAPNEAVLLALMERTGYQMIQENGQRKYGGPPPGWEGATPSRGCEVFVGKIPRDAYEDELVPVFEQIGNIYELRLMMDFSGTNRGYCFVMFTNKEDARKAVRELNNYELRKGRFLGVCLSVDNCRLFVGGIPKNKQRDEIFAEMSKITDGVVDVIVYPSASDKSKNRGFAFVEYNSHKAAAMARRKLIPGRIQLWGQSIAVDWAEPEAEVDDEIMAKVKILYVRNLMLTTSEDTIRDIFTQAVDKDNAIERVKKIRDYAFVHFREREDAVRAMNTLNHTLLENSQIEVCLAKPADKTEVRYTRGGGRGASPGAVCINDNTTNEAELKTGEALLEGYALNYDPNTYPAAAYYQQLGMHNPAAVVMAARGFPQARPMQAHPSVMRGQGTSRGRGRGAAGMRGAGARSYLSGVRNGTLKKKPGDEPRYYELRPDMVLTPTNPLTLKPQNVKSHVQVLEELCAKNGWAQPSYQLHSTMGHENSGRDVQLFLYKVNMPALGTAYQPTKLCRSTEEAKQMAAENVLKQLHIPVDPSGDGSQMAFATQAASMGQYGLASPTAATAGRTLFPMTTATTTTSYPSTLTSGMPLVANSYMMSPRMHPLTQSHGQGDMVGFDAFNFSQLAAATPVYPPYPPHQAHPAHPQ